MTQSSNVESIDTDLKAKLPAGPWQSEPDRKEWLDEATGYPCRIIRNCSGALCGYVGLEKSHPLFGLQYHESTSILADLYKQKEDMPVDFEKTSVMALLRASLDSEKGAFCPDLVINVHGGLSFSDYHKDRAENPYWWYGFDCSHYDDLSPAYEFSYDAVYRSFPYVIQQCLSLAQQLKDIETHFA